MTAQLELGDWVTYGDLTITAELDHNNEPILKVISVGQLIFRGNTTHIMDIYSKQLCNRVDAYTESGDLVRCNNCDRQLLLPTGTEICPVCKAEKQFSWLDGSKHQYDYDDIIKIKHSIKSMRKLTPNKYPAEEAINQIKK